MASEEKSADGDTGSSLLLNQPVVIDNGTATLKAGFAGSSKPKVSLISSVADAMFLVSNTPYFTKQYLLLYFNSLNVVIHFFRWSLAPKSGERST
jgi:hypothetical protein